MLSLNHHHQYIIDHCVLSKLHIWNMPHIEILLKFGFWLCGFRLGLKAMDFKKMPSDICVDGLRTTRWTLWTYKTLHNWPICSLSKFITQHSASDLHGYEHLDFLYFLRTSTFYMPMLFHIELNLFKSPSLLAILLIPWILLISISHIYWVWWLFLCATWLSHRIPIYLVNSVLGVYLRIFLDEINMWICRLSQADCSH